MVKEDSCCHRPALESRDGNQTMPGSEHVPRDVLEKSKRLRRHTVPAPSRAVECVEGLHRIQVTAEFDLQRSFLRLPDTPSQRAFETCEKAFLAASEFDHVTIKA